MDLARTVVIQRYETVDECIWHLQEVEALDEAKQQFRQGKASQVASGEAQAPPKKEAAKQ